MQADVDEAATRLQDATGLPREAGEVLDVGMGEGRHHQRAGALRDREPGDVGLDNPGHDWPGPPPGHSELVGGGVHSYQRPTRLGEGGRCTPVPQPRSRQQPDPRPASRASSGAAAAVDQATCSSYQSATPS